MSIDLGYLLFIKTKYTKNFERSDIEKLKKICHQAFKLGASVGTISNEKKSAIELGVLGRELDEYSRNVDRHILSTPNIVFSFCDHELNGPDYETMEQVSESIKKIRKSILDNLSMEARERFFIHGI